MSETSAPGRRVYNLAPELLERIRAYQTEHKIGSEAEAVRRLLTIALEMRDTVETILKQLSIRFADEGDLRVLAAEILARHSLVTELRFDDEELWFRMRSGRRGKIKSRGELERADDSEYDNWERWKPEDPKPPRRTGGGSGGWDAPKSDLDDDIPF